MKILTRLFRNKKPETEPLKEKDSHIIWIRWEREHSGHFICEINGEKHKKEQPFDNEDKMRRMYDNMQEKYHLVSVAPDFAVNPKKVDALNCSKEKITVLFSDSSELSSIEHFRGPHEKIQKAKIKQVIAESGLTAQNWFSLHDNYQFMMICRDIVTGIRKQDLFIIFDLIDERAPYYSAWDSTEQAKAKFIELQRQSPINT